jgi:hypothetical protein
MDLSSLYFDPLTDASCKEVLLIISKVKLYKMLDKGIMFWQFSKHNPTYTPNIKNERGNPVFFGHSNKDEEHVLLHLTGTLQTA